MNNYKTAISFGFMLGCLASTIIDLFIYWI